MKRSVFGSKNFLRRHGYELALAAVLTLLGILALVLSGFQIG
jgi:hypothetical protein